MRLLILGGPFTGKSTAHKAGKGVDPEHISEYEALEQKKGHSSDLWIDYERIVRDVIASDEEVVFAHFGPGKVEQGLASNREVRIVVLQPEELEKRANAYVGHKYDHHRKAAALHQLATLVHWLQTDGKWTNPKIYYSIDSALQRR